jgi:hypothetical protein
MCAYCGTRPGIQIEHVIARQFFYVSPPTFVKVPACLECNQKRGDGGPIDIQLDENYLRNVLCCSAKGNQSATAKSLLNGPIRRSFDAKRGDTAPILVTTTWKAELSPDGFLIERPDTFVLKWSRIYRVIRKITRGLYYHHVGKVLSADYDVYYYPFWTDKQFNQFKESLSETGSAQSSTLGQNVDFQYHHTVDGDDIYTTHWLMRFYGGFGCFAFTRRKDDPGKFRIADLYV